MNATRKPHENIGGMTRRILRTYDRASAADLAAGLDWYDRAEREATALAAGTNLNPVQCAGVIAALSPRCQWGPNLAGAVSMVEAATRGETREPIVAGTTANRAKAWRIARGEDPADVLRGPKVRAFFANITGDHDAVTVDVWAARAAEGTRNDRAPEGKRYANIATAYRRAAAARGISPRAMQAAVWTHIRGAAEGSYRPSTSTFPNARRPRATRQES